MPPGRPTKLTPDTTALICEMLRKGMPRGRSAVLAGVGKGTFFKWMEAAGDRKTGRYAEFRDAVLRAEAECIQRCIDTVQDVLASEQDGVRLAAAKLILTHRFPEDFSTRAEVRNTGADGGPIRYAVSIADADLRTMTTQELRQRLAETQGEPE